MARCILAEKESAAREEKTLSLPFFVGKGSGLPENYTLATRRKGKGRKGKCAQSLKISIKRKFYSFYFILEQGPGVVPDNQRRPKDKKEKANVGRKGKRT